MIYINENDIRRIGFDWQETISVIEQAVMCLSGNDFAQPVKPYLRYRNLVNRIIAMPAFVGGDVNTSGIKWIASFPGNLEKDIPRAHSVVILNDADTGEPTGIINTALLSIIRTASVSGLMIRYFNKIRDLDRINVGITGWGPIGKHHLKMCTDLLAGKIDRIFLYDIRDIDASTIDASIRDKVTIASSWEEAYVDADIFMTCTVSDAPYIDKAPKKRSLQLNVSLRDYKTDIYDYVRDTIIVDDWEEVCREKTDIEMIHIEKGLKEEDTRSIVDVVANNCLAHYDPEAAVMFNPMGMAVFDIALGKYYIERAFEEKIGQDI